MEYSAVDLEVLRVLRDKKELNGTAYFELHPGDLPEPFACCLEGSVFIDYEGFGFFAGCFEVANPEFDFFAFAAFDAKQLLRLDRALAQFEWTLVPGCSRDSLFSRFTSLLDRQAWDAVDTEALRVAIANACRELRTFIGQVQGDAKWLWVLGL